MARPRHAVGPTHRTWVQRGVLAVLRMRRTQIVSFRPHRGHFRRGQFRGERVFFQDLRFAPAAWYTSQRISKPRALRSCAKSAARVPFAITHAPGRMFITDARDEQYRVA